MPHVRYIDKTPGSYKNDGYETCYRWAHFNEIPFTRLAKALAGRPLRPPSP